MYTGNDGHAEPRKATQAFADAAVARGAQIVARCTVTSVETANGAVSGVRYVRRVERSGRVDTARIAARAPSLRPVRGRPHSFGRWG
jgi:glycine/D-amino acid oxidase-like deaminating enzyme